MSILDEGVYLSNLDSEIRKEAWELKDCCTRYSFQGVTVLTAAYALMGRVFIDNKSIGYAGFLLAMLALVLLNLITYKYGSSNRVYGYLLHLQRSTPRSFKGETEQTPVSSTFSTTKWQPWMRYVGWEEAMRAWRVVQPTIYYSIYRDPLDELRNRNRRNDRKLSMLEGVVHDVANILHSINVTFSQPPYPVLKQKYIGLGTYRWFLPSVLVTNKAAYNSGNYLKRLCAVLFLMLGIGYLFFVFATIATWYSESSLLASKIFAIILAIGIGLAFLYTSARLHKKTDRLESELESIHSCSVIWQAVVLAHYRALGCCEKYFGRSYYRYTFMLSVQAEHLIASGIENIHEWMGEQDASEIEKLLILKAEDIANHDDREALIEGVDKPFITDELTVELRAEQKNEAAT